MADPIMQEGVRIYPYSKEKTTQYVREEKSSDKVLLDNEFITVIATAYQPDDYYGYIIDLFFFNKSDVTMAISFADTTVNGHNLDIWKTKTLASGKCLFNSCTWEAEAFETSTLFMILFFEGDSNSFRIVVSLSLCVFLPPGGRI